VAKHDEDWNCALVRGRRCRIRSNARLFLIVFEMEIGDKFDSIRVLWFWLYRFNIKWDN
jgi:hypothetical protein